MYLDMTADQSVPLTLYTDTFVIRGHVRTRQHRITDVLNRAEDDFLVVEGAVFEEFGGRGEIDRADFAQVNLSAVLFAVSDIPVEATPELRTPKVQERALVTVPPFRVTGRLHLLPERNLRDALMELTERFIPITDATYWSERVGEPRTTVTVVTVNRERAHILAPHTEVDPWAGLDEGAQGAPGSRGEDGPGGDQPGADPAGSAVPGDDAGL
jgi:hypothetical protein